MRRRNRRKKQSGLIIVLLVGLFFVMSAGYAAFCSRISISGQSTISEKTYTPQQLKTEYCNTISGDGLYVDTYETGRCIYRGSNPNNYISFNNELWRIIAVESDGSLKIIKKDSIGKKFWDAGVGVYGYNDWSRPAEVNSFLNTDYYNSLNDMFQVIIESHVWNIGAATHGNSDLANQILEEKAKTWSGKVGLIYVSDYLKANSNVSQCGNWKENNSNLEICKQTNFLVPIEGRFWTITAYDTIIQNRSTIVCNINNNGGISAESAGYIAYDILPTMYLKSNIKLSGRGTSTWPYEIVVK